LVVMCPYEGGCNSALFYHSGDIYKNGAPDCLIGTRWISRDHLYNDVNSQDPLDPLNQFTGDEAPPFLLDWADFEFNSETQSREWKDVNWTYRLGPPVKPMCEDAEGGLVDINPVTPFLASGTETSVDNSTRPLSYEPTVMSPFKLCDFNSDGDCDVFDFQFFQGALGACEGDANYHPIADIDGDGCVTLGDQQDLFLVQPKGIYLPIVLKNTS
jgi:hypothetical protein